MYGAAQVNRIGNDRAHESHASNIEAASAMTAGCTALALKGYIDHV
jgi:hypothetical protein